jgi:hypothetical protein
MFRLQSPEGQAAFRDFVPTVIARHKVRSLFVVAEHHPPSYLWAGTIVADTFYGSTTRPYRQAGMTGGGGHSADGNSFDRVERAIEDSAEYERED